MRCWPVEPSVGASTQPLRTVSSSLELHQLKCSGAPPAPHHSSLSNQSAQPAAGPEPHLHPQRLGRFVQVQQPLLRIFQQPNKLARQQAEAGVVAAACKIQLENGLAVGSDS